MGRKSRGRTRGHGGKLLTIRCTAEEIAQIKAAAIAEGKTQADYVRDRLLREPGGEGDPVDNCGLSSP